MALVANNTYAYAADNDEQIFVKGSDLTDLGAWSPATTYSFRDAALYNGAYYVCLLANTNTPPSGNISDEWSVLVLVREADPGGHTADEAYALAEEALETAVEVGQSGSQFAFDLYVAGTNYTNNTAVAAIGTAIQQGSEFAYNLFIQGTNYTNTAAVAAVQIAAQEGSQFTVMLRDQGTGYTDTLVAAEAVARQNGDSAIFVSVNNRIDIETAQRINDDGTLAFIGQQIAQQGSHFSYLLYTTGTNYAQTLVEAEAAIRAANDFFTFVAGTNYTDSQVQAAQAASGSLSLELYWAGTAFTDIRVTQERQARVTNDDTLGSWIGTNSDRIEDLATILGASFNGTFSLYMAQVSRGKPDTKITVVGGVVTGFEQSPFVWDDWAGYDDGPAPSSFNRGSSWDDVSYGSISTEIFAGTVAQDTLQDYADGSISLLDQGVGFNANGTFQYGYTGLLGIDQFETYALGTIVNPDMNGGTYFTSPAVIFSW